MSHGFTAIAKRGKAHMILKRGARPRRHKDELDEYRQSKEEKKRHINMLLEAESMFKSNNCNIEEATHALKQNIDMREYLKSKGLMDSEGRMNV